MAHDKKTFRFLIIIFLLALINTSFFIFVYKYRQPLDSISSYYDSIAWSFAQGKGLIDPWWGQGQPLIYKTPSYPIFVGIIYNLFGHNPLLVLIIQAILYSLCTVLLYFIARKVCDESTSILASLALALYFPLAYYASGILTEIFSIFLSALVILFWLKYSKTRQKKYMAFSGIFLGINVLCKPIFLFFPVVIIIHLLWLGIKRLELLAATGILLVSISLVMTPWVVRNYLIYNEFILLSKGNIQDQLLQAALDHKYSLWDWDFWHTVQDDPRTMELNRIKEKVERLIANDPSLNKEALLSREATNIIRSDLKRYFEACLVRVLRLWLSYPSRVNNFVKAAVIGFDSILLILAVVGFVASRNHWKELSVFWLPLVYITVMHIPLHVEPRYAAPLKPYLLIFVSIGAIHSYRWFSGREKLSMFN